MRQPVFWLYLFQLIVLPLEVLVGARTIIQIEALATGTDERQSQSAGQIEAVLAEDTIQR